MRRPPAQVSHPHRHRRTAALLCALVVILLAPVGVATPAYAKPSVADIERQIDEANNKLEPIIEDYNRVHSLLVDNQAKAAVLEAKL